MYTTAASLVSFTTIPELKTANQTWLLSAVIPRAEAYLLGAFGPFASTTGACGTSLELAANMLSEWVYVRSQAISATAGGYKSESMGEYSYTLADMNANDSLGGLLQEIGFIVADCRDETASMPISAGSRSQVFMELPGYVTAADGSHERVFSPTLETALVKGWLQEIAEFSAWYGWSS